jgi:hypothetical protein
MPFGIKGERRILRIYVVILLNVYGAKLTP